MHLARRAEQLDDPHIYERFTRLAYGFSKKLENLAAATAIHVAVYNFCRIHLASLHARDGRRCHRRLWGMDDLFDAVTEHAERKRKDARLAKLIERIRGERR